MTSFGSSTGVRNLMMLAAPAMPNARARVLPMMIIIIAPDTQSSVCACSIVRPRSRGDGWWIAVTSRPIIAGDDQLQQLEERASRHRRRPAPAARQDRVARHR